MPANRSETAEQALVATAVVLTGAVFLTNTSDPVNVPKLAALLLCAVLLVGCVAIHSVCSRMARLPWGAAALSGLLLLAALSLSALVAPQRADAVLGAYGRSNGLLAYGCALIIFFCTLRAFTADRTKLVALAVLLSGSFTGTYGLLQRVGVDAIHWQNPFNPIIATLGNPDFASAYLGITVPIALAGTFWNGWAKPWRVMSAAAAGLCTVAALLSSAVQGPLAAAAGSWMVLLALALNGPAGRQRRAIARLTGLLVFGIAVVGLGAAGVGPLQSKFKGISYQARTWYWEAALTMWRRSPLTGVGLDSYGLYWRRDRPLANPRTVGGDAYSDSAHSVPLQHLAQGGLLLIAAYCFFLCVVSIALLRGLRRLRGQDRLLLAGLGGAWAAYQVQSLVSIDQVPLLVLNFVLGAAVVVASGTSRVREIRLPGALPVQPVGRGRRPRAPLVRRLTGLDVTLVAGLALVMLAAMWVSLRPLRANHDIFVGDTALSRGDGTAALAAFQRAVALEPDIGLYRTRIGELYSKVQQPAQAEAAFEKAFDLDATQIGAGRTAARYAQAAGDTIAASRLFDRVLALDPTNSTTILEWSQFHLAQSQAPAVDRRLERAVRDLPTDSGLWASLGDARAASGDLAGAEAAYRRSLALTPGQPTAVAGLQKLTKDRG